MAEVTVKSDGKGRLVRCLAEVLGEATVGLRTGRRTFEMVWCDEMTRKR